MEIKELSEVNEEFLSVLSELTEVGLSVEEARKIRCNSTTYVAVLGPKIIGTASLLIEQKFIHKGGKVAYIEDVVVSHIYRKLHVGKKLVKHLILEAKKQGCYKVTLCCFEEVAPFYEKIGFRKFNLGMRLDIDI